MRRLMIASLALLGLAAPCLAVEPAQGPPDFSIDTSGTYRNLNVRDATLGARIPMGYIDTTTHTFVPYSSVAVEAFGAKGDSNGTTGNGTDDTAALAACAASGEICSLRPGSTYRVTSRVDVPDGGGFIGPRSAVIYADPAGFTHASTSGTNRYGTTAVVLMAQGGTSGSYTPLARATFVGFKLVLGAGDATTDGRWISGIVARNVTWLDIHDVEITAGTLGAGLQIANVSGIIANNYIHDFYDDRNWDPEQVQMLGIWIDNDPVVPNAGSHNLRVTGNVVARMMVGPTQYADSHWQPDGIGMGSIYNHDIEIDHNDVSYVGKGIWQLGGTRNYVHDNRISYAFNQALVCGSGCQYSTFSNNIIYAAGAAGVASAGTGTNRNTTGNIYRNNSVFRVGDTDWSVFGAGRFDGGATACYMTGPDAVATYKQTGDKYINNFCDPDTSGAGDITWAFWPAGSPPQSNDWLDNVGLPGTAGIVKESTGELGIYRDGSQQIASTDAANAWTAAQTITTTAGGSLLTLTGTPDNGGIGTSLVLSHRRATPTAGDTLGSLQFYGNDSGLNSTLYGYLGSAAQTVTNGSETANLQLATIQAGALANRVYVGLGLMSGATNDPGSGGVAFAGKFAPDRTITAAGTTGAQTINKPAGTVNFAAAATSLVVTNSLVTVNTVIACTVQTNDTTMKSAQCVPASGSFTMYPNANPTAETRVGFLVMN